MTRQVMKPNKKQAGAAHVRAYLANALAGPYDSDLRHFRAWGGRIPATPQMVARYVAECAGLLKASTLERSLAAISSAHSVAEGCPIGARVASPERSQLTLRSARS